MSSTPKTIVIHVGGSQPLDKAAQEIAFAAGWKWGSAGATVIYLNSEALFLEADKTMSHSSSHYARTKYPEAAHFDARTDMGKLIDLLDEMKRPPAPVAPKVNGYDGSYIKGAKYVKFGCAEINLEMLSDITKTMLPYGGNRSVQSVTLSSGVSLDKGAIAAILEYVAAVNKA